MPNTSSRAKGGPRSHLRSFITNPIILIAPLVIVLWLIWQQYGANHTLVATPSDSILTGGDFENLAAGDLPTGWNVQPSGQLQYAIGQTTGYQSPHALSLHVTNYQNGSLFFATPEVSVEAGKTYLFKGWYQATSTFSVLVQYNYQNGPSTVQVVKQYQSSSTWATVADAFVAPANLQSVQFIYDIASNNHMELDNVYMQPQPPDVYVEPGQSAQANLIPNPDLVGNIKGRPKSWSSYSAGQNQATFAEQGGPSFKVTVANYYSGQAKWQYQPITVQPGQAFHFSVTYMSNTPSNIVAEYVTSSGKHQFQELGTLLPAQTWVTNTTSFEAPPGASTMFVSVVLQANGELATKDYALNDATKPGDRYWNEPLVSYTFDDGWETAYTNGARLLSSYGYLATFYLNPSTIDTPDFMSSSQVTDLQNHGDEIASHGYVHLDFTTLVPQQIDYQLGHAHDYFTQVLKEPTVDFATPYGKTDPQVEYYARKYYASLRGTDDGINTRQNFNPYDLTVFYVGNDTPLDKINQALMQTKAEHGWLILVYHRIDTTTSGETATTPVHFKQQIEVVKKSGLPVKTVQAALKEVEQQ